KQSRDATRGGDTSQRNCLLAGSSGRFDVSPRGADAYLGEAGGGGGASPRGGPGSGGTGVWKAVAPQPGRTVPGGRGRGVGGGAGRSVDEGEGSAGPVDLDVRVDDGAARVVGQARDREDCRPVVPAVVGVVAGVVRPAGVVERHGLGAVGGADEDEVLVGAAL